MRRGRVTFLGTGTSHGVPMIGCRCATCLSTDPRDRRSRPSIHLAVDEGPQILIDTSTDLRQQALERDISRVDVVLFTHSHADHVMGLDDLRRFNAIQSAAIPAYADAFTAAEIRRIFKYVFEPPEEKGGGIPQITLHEIDGPFDVAGVRVTPVPLLHGRRPIFGFRIGAFAYLTDCSAIPEAAWPLLADLDVIVLDALRHRPHPTHFTVQQALDVLARLAPRQAWLTHICHDLPHAETNRALPPGVALAYDGLTFDIDVD